MSGERVVIESSWPRGEDSCDATLSLTISPLDAMTGTTKETIDLAVAAAESAMLLEAGVKVTITYEELEDDRG